MEAWPTLSIADNSEDLKPPLDKTFSCSLIKIAHIEYKEHVWFALGLENGELTVIQTDAKTRDVKTTLSHSLDGLSDLMFFPRSGLNLFFNWLVVKYHKFALREGKSMTLHRGG